VVKETDHWLESQLGLHEVSSLEVANVDNTTRGHNIAISREARGVWAEHLVPKVRDLVPDFFAGFFELFAIF